MSSRASQTTTTLSPRRAGTKRSSSTFQRKRGVAVPRATIDDVSIFNLDSAAEAGVIILLVRIITLGGGKAALSKQLEEQIERAKEKNVDISDLYYTEDQGEDAGGAGGAPGGGARAARGHVAGARARAVFPRRARRVVVGSRV